MPTRMRRPSLSAMTEFLSTFEPATGALIAELPIGDAHAEVAAARAAWPGWAATPLAERVETLRRFADIVRDRADAFADLIARETGKPLWEAKTEVDTVIAKVAISITAQAERAGERSRDRKRRQQHRDLRQRNPRHSLSSPFSLARAPSAQHSSLSATLAPSLLQSNRAVYGGVTLTRR